MDRVRMIRPDGGTAWVVSDRLEEYRKAGYREADVSEHDTEPASTPQKPTPRPPRRAVRGSAGDTKAANKGKHKTRKEA